MTQEEEDKKLAKELLESAIYKFAKSMPQIPHSYTLKETWKNPKDFDFVISCWEKYQVKEMFFKRAFYYLIIGEYKYFPMKISGKPIILINRASIKNTY